MKTTILISILAFYSIVQYAQVTEEWINFYSGYYGVLAAASVIDNGGNIYITGSGAGSVPLTGSDIYTIKINSQGVFQWEATYNGSADEHDYGIDIALDPSGNVYVIGESPGAVGGFGTGKDYLTIKYDSQGNELWVQRFYGNPSFTTENYDSPNAIAVDITGNVYLTGASWAAGQSNHDCLTIKYDTNGNLIWTARYDQAGPGSYGKDVKVDAGGNVYVFGVGPDPVLPEYVIIKYNSDGTEQWVKNYGEYGVVPVAMEIDDDGNVYATGGDEQFNIVKYNSSGDSIWSAIFSGPGSFARPSSLTVDGSGNVYVTGMAVNSGFTGQEYATVKYNSSGQELWSAAYNGLGDDQFLTVANAIELDAAGNVYVTGRSQGANFTQGDVLDYATVKYNTDGVEQWAVRYHRPPDGNETAVGVHVTNDGKVYVTGYGEVSSNPSEIITIKYSQGTTLTMNATAGSQILEVASTSGFSVGDHIVINPGGLTEETNTISGFGSILLQMPLQFDHNSGEQVVIIITSSVEDISAGEIPSDFYLLQNYPNPFNPSTKIRWQSPVGSHQILKIYDVLGNEVATLVDEYLPAETYETDFSGDGLSSGIYFYQLQAGSFVETKKMILIK